jgi:hypothetical protein
VVAGIGGHLKWRVRSDPKQHDNPGAQVSHSVKADPVTQMVSGAIDYRIGTNEGITQRHTIISDRPVLLRTERPELLGASEDCDT